MYYDDPSGYVGGGDFPQEPVHGMSPEREQPLNAVLGSPHTYAPPRNNGLSAIVGQANAPYINQYVNSQPVTPIQAQMGSPILDLTRKIRVDPIQASVYANSKPAEVMPNPMEPQYYGPLGAAFGGSNPPATQYSPGPSRSSILAGGNPGVASFGGGSIPGMGGAVTQSAGPTGLEGYNVQKMNFDELSRLLRGTGGGVTGGSDFEQAPESPIKFNDGGNLNANFIAQGNTPGLSSMMGGIPLIPDPANPYGHSIPDPRYVQMAHQESLANAHNQLQMVLGSQHAQNMLQLERERGQTELEKTRQQIEAAGGSKNAADMAGLLKAVQSGSPSAINVEIANLKGLHSFNPQRGLSDQAASDFLLENMTDRAANSNDFLGSLSQDYPNYAEHIPPNKLSSFLSGKGYGEQQLKKEMAAIPPWYIRQLPYTTGISPLDYAQRYVQSGSASPSDVAKYNFLSKLLGQ